MRYRKGGFTNLAQRNLGVMYTFVTFTVVMASWVYTLVKMYQITYFKYVQFTGLPGWLRQ